MAITGAVAGWPSKRTFASKDPSACTLDRAIDLFQKAKAGLSKAGRLVQQACRRTPAVRRPQLAAATISQESLCETNDSVSDCILPRQRVLTNLLLWQLEGHVKADPLQSGQVRQLGDVLASDLHVLPVSPLGILAHGRPGRPEVREHRAAANVLRLKDEKDRPRERPIVLVAREHRHPVQGVHRTTSLLLQSLASGRLGGCPARAGRVTEACGRRPQVGRRLAPALGHAESDQHEAKGRPVAVELRMGLRETVEPRLRGLAAFASHERPVWQAVQKSTSLGLVVVFLRAALVFQNVRKECQQQRIRRAHRATHLVRHRLHLPEPRALVPWTITNVVQADGHDPERQQTGRRHRQVHVVVRTVGRVVDVFHEQGTAKLEVVHGRQLGCLLVRAEDHDPRPALLARPSEGRPAPPNDREAVGDVSQPLLSGQPLRLLVAPCGLLLRATFRAGLLEELRDAALPHVHPVLRRDGRPLLHLSQAKVWLQTL